MGEDKAKEDPGAGGRRESSFPTKSGASPIEEIGTEIGPYKLLETLGEGSFGIVYLAGQKHPIRRKVALKLIKPGMDTKQVIARFEQERQVLAHLDHPNIAHVVDAGTTDKGLPYFVMEYVDGVPITDFCDDKPLGIEERLEIFVDVCEAIQHAHQKGIIHRDIKPSNVLVTLQDKKAIPKVIDFGVAKAISGPLTEKTLFTQKGQLIGTPAYMSPEQAELTNQDIDTRTDIYSLGVLLYQLLTGALPFEDETLRSVAFDEILRIIRSQDPPKPSARLTSLGEKAKEVAASRRTDIRTLSKRLHRELEWIPLKAMRKERDRRYKTVAELGEDIRKYLSGNPLVAGPESVVYRARKLARKHAGPLASIASIVLLLVGGLAGSLTMYFQAVHARGTAEEQRVEAVQAKTSAQRYAEQLEKVLYVSRIRQAELELGIGNYYRAEQLLSACPSHLWNWEWFYLWQVCGSVNKIVSTHSRLASDATFSPDGCLIALGTYDGRLMVWDASAGRQTDILGSSRNVDCVAFGPDSRHIVSGGGDETVRLWDLETRLSEAIGTHDAEVIDVALSPDGMRVASVDKRGTIKIWDAKSHVETASFRLASDTPYKWLEQTCVRFSPTGDYVVVNGRGTIEVWDLTTGERARSMSSVFPPFVFTQNGGSIILCTGAGEILKWRWLEDGRDDYFKVDVAVPYTRAACAFSPDGRYFAAPSGGKVKVWDMVGGRMREAQVHGEGDTVQSMSFSPSGDQIVSVGWTSPTFVWRHTVTESFRKISPLTGPVGIKPPLLAVSPDGTQAAILLSTEGFCLWDMVKDELIQWVGGEGLRVSAAVYSADGTQLAWIDREGRVSVRDLQRKEDRRFRCADANDADANGVRGFTHEASISFTEDGRRIVAVITRLVMSPTARNQGYNRMVTDETVTYDTATGQPLLQWCKMRERRTWVSVPPVLIAGDGHHILTATPECFRVIDSVTADEVSSFGDGTARAFACGHDAKYVATLSSNDLQVWDTVAAAEIASVQVETTDAFCMSADGTRIALGQGKRIVVLDAQTGERLLSLDAKSDVQFVIFSRASKELFAVCEDDSIKIWSTADENKLRDPVSWFNRGSAYWAATSFFAAGKDEEAICNYDRAIELNPRYAEAYAWRAAGYLHEKRYELAVSDLNSVIRIEPNDPYSLNELARLYATCPADGLRNGTKAVELATRASVLTKWRVPSYLDTLAAGHAEAGDSTMAVEWQKRAIALFAELNRKEHVDFEERLKLYQSGKPYRQE